MRAQIQETTETLFHTRHLKAPDQRRRVKKISTTSLRSTVAETFQMSRTSGVTKTGKGRRSTCARRQSSENVARLNSRRGRGSCLHTHGEGQPGKEADIWSMEGGNLCLVSNLIRGSGHWCSKLILVWLSFLLFPSFFSSGSMLRRRCVKRAPGCIFLTCQKEEKREKKTVYKIESRTSF